MAPGQKLYPRATVRKIVKAHSNCNVSKNVDVMIFLDYVLFMQTLVKEAAIESKRGGERGITSRSVKKVTAAEGQQLHVPKMDLPVLRDGHIGDQQTTTESIREGALRAGKRADAMRCISSPMKLAAC
ncbi:uncharacterized protein E0L32_008843 [Thyridium curvatum]|uniref:Transcription factor CBF/NF-Y/archaeal histone domain-containing protein n=1 Tax=Thyridium curvatum TaxID=1093900 RepID=A0A507ATG8_9PEZI|nr:uncharacterized protein E0L32_008843 [Thyridium curvatum]TPX09996.1 hypothetical protein E0L32_008843 [Thyridium curvatum]